MENSEATENVMCETFQEQLLPIENNCQPVENLLLNNDFAEPSKIVDQISNSENQIPVESTDVNTQNANVTAELNSIVPTDNSMPPLPPLPKNDNGQMPQPPAAPIPADYNIQNYANYNNYMYNYNNYYGYPYPQYQWDYNSQQYYQPYQNYYNYNFNQANQTQTSKPPPPPPDAVQLPVEEKPANKTNSVVDDSNRYSPTAETDDDDPLKGLSENYKSNILIEKPTQTINVVPFQTVTSEQIEVQQNIPESIDSIVQQTIDPPTLPSITAVQQQGPVIAQVQLYNIQAQQPSYPINPQSQMQSTETVNEVLNQQQTSPALNGKDDSIEKVSKASTVLGKSQAKKRLMAFSMMKQKLQEQNNSVTDNQSPDIGEGNDGEFVPEHNVFQTVTKKKIVTNKKVAKVIKAQQTIEQIEEMKKDELLQGNNAALYQHLLRSGGNEAPILQKLGIESLAEKYSAKIREQDKRSSRHHHRRRDESRRSHKYRRRSHSKSRSRSRSTEKPKMRALEVKSWKDFVKGGFHFDRFRRFKMDEAKEIKDQERKSRKKKRHGDSRTDGKNHKNESNIPSETEKGIDQKLRYNLLDRKKEILKGLEVNTHEGDSTKDFPSYIIRCTKTKPFIKFSENPANATYHLQNRQQMLASLLPEIEAIVLKFLSAMKPKKLKENHTHNNCNGIDEKLLVMMKDKNIYPFKGWWPKTNFIVTQVKEDPDVEIDKDVLMNEITTSKRTKKSRFNDDSSLVELRPTVPSKWDSDYDGSPAAENKVAYVGVTQSVEMNTNDNFCTIKREENNSLDISHQEEAMDTASDVDEDEPQIEALCPVPPVQIQEPQGHTKLNTEYEEFLKIVKAEKEECDVAITTNANVTTQKDNENNLSTKSVSLNNDSIQDESEEYMSNKSSDESVSLQNAAEESDSNDRSFIEELSTINSKNRKKKKSSSKKSKTFKNKGSKKKRHKSSSSESSQDSESESDSSSDDSDSESTDSTSTVEKKKKKKSKNKRKRKTKTNYKKKHRSDKNKTKSPEDEKDANSSILNLIEKALNVEIKKRPSDSKEPKHKKKKRKHEKKENKLNEESDDKFEKVKDCLKETITKLVKTEKVNKNQSLSCDETVIEVLKYLNDKEKKNKKSKKSLKRKHESDISDDEETLKKSKLVDSCLKPKDNDKKKKSKNKKSVERKSVDSDEQIIKKKSKKKSKTTDTSEAEDVEVLNQNKSKNDSVQFFELRPNEWNITKKSSRRGVVHHSEKNKTSPVHDTSKCNNNIRKKKSDSLNLINKCPPSNSSKNKSEIPKSLSEFKEHFGEKESKKQSQKPNKNIRSDKIDDVSINIVEEKKLVNFNSDNESNEKVKHSIEENYESLNKSADMCPNDIFKLKNDLEQTEFLKNEASKQHNTIKNLNSIFKPQTQSTSSIDLYDKPPITCTVIKAVTETVSYRDKVKMNLKKLSTCQNIPFGFGFSTPISLIKSDKIKDLKVTNKEKEDKSNKDKPKVSETQLLKSDIPKVINFPQTQIEEPDVTKKELLKINIETNNKALHHSYDWDDSEESNTDRSLVTSTITSEHSSDERESEQINSSLLKNDSPNISNKNEKFSNDGQLKKLEEITSNVFETNSSSDSVIKEQEIPLEVDNFLMEKEITTLSNLTDQHLNGSTEGLENDVVSFKMEKKDSDPMYSQKSRIDILEVSKSNNELITQWTSDWINLDKSVTEINHSSTSKSRDDKLRLKKKSRWDKQPMDNKIDELQSFNNVQEEYKDETETTILTDELKYTPSNNEDDLNNEQNQICEIMSINCINYDYHEISPFAYDDYSETYEQYTGIPMYSEMKSIEHDLLSPIDYSVYENFNPHYNYHTEDYDMWKSVDTDTSEHEIIQAIPTTDETVAQLVNDFEHFPSDNTFVGEVEFSKEEVLNENIDTIVSQNQEEIVKNEKSDSAANRDELFVKLYHQHFQHYNQNPIKYSLSDPVIINTDKVKVNIPDSLTPQEKLSETEKTSDDIMSIPLQTRAYVCILDDDNTNLYLTSDNYMAYCATEDRCMVHISVNACSRDGVVNDVRHCFNVNLNGSINEYWLHADLIPFHVPSDAESGVFSDDEMDSLDSDSGHEEDIDNDNNENDDNIIENEWEIVDNIHDNVNSWLDEPYILQKYNIENDVNTHINQEHYVTSSSECDTDGSEFSESYVEMFNDKQNINENHFQKSLESKDDNHKHQNMIDVVTPTNVSENTENSHSLVKTEECIKSSEKLVLDVEIQNEIDMQKEVNENNLTSKINSENNDVVLGDLVEKVNNDNISVISEEKENNNGNESGEFMKKEVTVADLSMMDTIINQKILIQKLKVRAKEKIRKKLPDTIMIRYSDNMDTIKHPFLGLFQPPTNSILSKPRSTKPPRTLNLSKRVTFADGIRPGDNLAASPTHDDFGCPLSPPPLKTLMRETLKFKRNMYPFTKSKVRTKLTMVKKKVAKVTPSIKETNSSVIEYYISRRRLADLPIGEIPNSSFLSSDHSSNNNEGSEKNSTPPRPTREVTPVPSDTECWNDDDTIKNNR